MKCVDCLHLCSITGQPLPEEQRELLQARDPESFTWLVCSKGLIKFAPGAPEVRDQVLSEWECEDYQEQPPEPQGVEARPPEGRMLPMWQKVAVLTLVFLALVGSVIATLYFVL